MFDIFQCLGIKNNVFCDGENISPDNFVQFLVSENLLNINTQIVCLLGANQNQNEWYNSVINEVHALKKGISYNIFPIRINTEGKNALDMILASYIGVIMDKNPNANFMIVSHDLGYNHIVKHFSSLGILIKLVSEVGSSPTPKKQNSTLLSKDDLNTFVKHLSKIPKRSRPKTDKGLFNTIKPLCKENLDSKKDIVTAELIKCLLSKNLIKKENSKITWK